MKNNFKDTLNQLVSNNIYRIIILAAGIGILIVSLIFLLRSFQSVGNGDVETLLESYEQSGQYDYTVYLKPNTIYEQSQLPPGDIFFTQLVDHISMQYQYKFNSDQSYEDQQFLYSVSAKFGSEGFWEKEIVLLPTTITTESDFSVTFALPIDESMAIQDTFMNETRANLTNPKLTLNVHVEPQIETDHGTLDEPFDHALAFSLDELNIKPETQLEKSVFGTLTSESAKNNRPQGQARLQRFFSGLGILISLIIIAYIIWIYYEEWKSRSEDSRDFHYAQKRLGGLFVETAQLTPLGEKEEVIQLSSLRDLVNLADETLRPVLYSKREDGSLAFVILRLGYVRYEYHTQSKANDQIDLGGVEL